MESLASFFGMSSQSLTAIHILSIFLFYSFFIFLMHSSGYGKGH